MVCVDPAHFDGARVGVGRRSSRFRRRDQPTIRRVVDSIRDELDIRRVIADYCLFVDDGDFRRLLECFTTDAEFIFAGRSRVGHDVLLRFFEATGAPEQRGKHMVANTVIDVDAGGVTARSMSDFVFYGRPAGGSHPSSSAGTWTICVETADVGVWPDARP